MMPKPGESHGSDVSLQHADNENGALHFLVGRGVSETIIETAKEILANAPRHPDFIKFEELAFLYEKLGGEKTNPTVNMVVNDWINKPENIQRAASTVGRGLPSSQEELVRAYCPFRFKSLKKKWQKIEGLAVDSIEERERSTVVIIALEPLDEHSGCFVSLDSGQDVCVDGRANIVFPGTGDGLGILIDLNL